MVIAIRRAEDVQDDSLLLDILFPNKKSALPAATGSALFIIGKYRCCFKKSPEFCLLRLDCGRISVSLILYLVILVFY
jgi:hypothetical protein